MIKAAGMQIDNRIRIVGATTGYHEDAIFKLVNGRVWQQTIYHCQYHYAYQPLVRLFRQGTQQMLEIDGTQHAVPVIQASIDVEGVIVSEFRGFDSDVEFRFQNGQTWVPAEYKYAYHYAHRPQAAVVSGPSGPLLHVEGMSSALRVRRVR